MPPAGRSPRANPTPDGPSLDGGTGIALYAQLAGILRHQIASGQWAPGHKLDNFDRLAAQYNVGRVTVRQAVARLVDEGLLSSRRGLGTVVLARPTAHTATRWADVIGSARTGEPMQIEVLRQQRVTELPEELGADFAHFDDYVELCTVHATEAGPFALMRLFVAHEVHRLLPRPQIQRAKVLNLILENAPAHSEFMRQRVTVEPADIAVATSLRCAIGSPVARVLRQLCGKDRRISYAGLSWYRGDSFVLDTMLPRAVLDQVTRR